MLATTVRSGKISLFGRDAALRRPRSVAANSLAAHFGRRSAPSLPRRDWASARFLSAWPLS